MRKKTQIRLFMFLFVITMYAIAFMLDSIAVTSQIGAHIGNLGFSYAGFAELLIVIIAGYYVWKTGDSMFFGFLLLVSITFIMCGQLTFGRIFSVW